MTPHKLIHSNPLLCLILIVNRLFGNSRAVSALCSVCQKKIKVLFQKVSSYGLSKQGYVKARDGHIRGCCRSDAVFYSELRATEAALCSKSLY